MRRAWRSGLVALALVASRPSAQKDLLAHSRRTLQPVADNTLYEHPQGSLSNGVGDSIFAGLTATGSKRRALLRFDVAGNVPSGARIVGAELTLHVTRTAAGAQNVSLHLAFSDWGEGASDALGEEGTGGPAAPGDATWLHTFYSGSYWTTPGGDFAVTPSATESIGFFGPFRWSSAQMVSDVQAWLDAPVANFGWVVVGAEPPFGFRTAKRFGSREGPFVLRPSLRITYEWPKGACCVPDGSCYRVSAPNCHVLGGTYQGDLTTCFPDPCPP